MAWDLQAVAAVAVVAILAVSYAVGGRANPVLAALGWLSRMTSWISGRMQTLLGPFEILWRMAEALFMIGIARDVQSWLGAHFPPWVTTAAIALYSAHILSSDLRFERQLDAYVATKKGGADPFVLIGGLVHGLLRIVLLCPVTWYDRSGFSLADAYIVLRTLPNNSEYFRILGIADFRSAACLILWLALLVHYKTEVRLNHVVTRRMQHTESSLSLCHEQALLGVLSKVVQGEARWIRDATSAALGYGATSWFIAASLLGDTSTTMLVSVGVAGAFGASGAALHMLSGSSIYRLLHGPLSRSLGIGAYLTLSNRRVTELVLATAIFCWYFRTALHRVEALGSPLICALLSSALVFLHNIHALENFTDAVEAVTGQAGIDDTAAVSARGGAATSEDMGEQPLWTAKEAAAAEGENLQ